MLTVTGQRVRSTAIPLHLLVVLLGVPLETGCAPLTGVTPLWQQYERAASTDGETILPDFSHSGYHRCEIPIPNPELPLFNVVDHGAIPGDSLSDQAAIQSTIRQAEEHGGGIVFFPPGRYLVNMDSDSGEPIRLTKGNMVLRGSGSGPGGTEVVMVNALEPADSEVLHSSPFMIIWAAPTQSSDKLTSITRNARRGTYGIEVEDAENLHVGQWINLHVRNREAFDRYLRPYQANPAWVNGLVVNEKHQIDSIDGNRVGLKEPLQIDILADDGWIVIEYHVLEEIGIEDVRFVGSWKGEFKHHRSAVDDGGWSAIEIDNAVNSWIRRCQFVNWNRSVYLRSCSFFSILEVGLSGTPGHTGIHTRGGYGVLVGFADNQANHHHGPGVGYQSCSTVFWNCTYSGESSFDAHSGSPYATLLDNVCGGIRSGRAGGGIANLPNHLRYLVLWNFRNTGPERQGYDFWRGMYDTFLLPIVVGIHGNRVTFKDGTCQINESPGKAVRPESLFEAQLIHRMGSLPDWLSDLKKKYDNDNTVERPCTPR